MNILSVLESEEMARHEREANGVIVSREIIGANDVLDMGGSPVLGMDNTALMGMTG